MDRKWRQNRHQNQNSQHDSFGDNFISNPGARREGRLDEQNGYERDNRRIPDSGHREPRHTHYVADDTRDDIVHPPIQPTGYRNADRGQGSSWRSAESNNGRYNNRGYPRNSYGGRSARNETRSASFVEAPEWNEEQRDTRWREREEPTGHPRNLAMRGMDWEPQPRNDEWVELPQPPPPGHPHADPTWTGPHQWVDPMVSWPNNRGPPLYDESATQPFPPEYQQQVYPQRHVDFADNSFPRTSVWDREMPKPDPMNFSQQIDNRDNRKFENNRRSDLPRKSEKRPHSRSPSAESSKQRHPSHSPKRRRRDSPPPSNSKGNHTRRSRSPDSRQGERSAYEHSSEKTSREDEPRRRENYYGKGKFQAGRSRYDGGNREKYQKQERYRHKHNKDEPRGRSYSRSRSRSHSRSRSRSRSRSSSQSGGRKKSHKESRGERSFSGSRSRSPKSPLTMKSVKAKPGGVKHRLPPKSAPRIPSINSVPLVATRAVLPSAPSSQSSNQKFGHDHINTPQNGARGPPKGPRAQTEAGNRGDIQSGLSRFFPDATTNRDSTLASVPGAAIPSLLDRIEPVKSKKNKARMVPIGPPNPQKPSHHAKRQNTNEGEMLPPTAPNIKTEGPPAPVTIVETPTINNLSENPAALQILRGESSSRVAVESSNPALPSDSLTPVEQVTKTPKPEEVYKIMTQVGEGTFGKVYKARNQLTGANVALKRIRMEGEKDGFPVTAMREIKLLQSLKHDGVVKLYEMMVSKGLVYMVFEYVHHDLVGVLQQTQFNLMPEHLKSLSHQMLAGLAYLHSKAVIHRDLKASNILVDTNGRLKLADFGLARFYQKRRQADYTNRVITLWYRPPELLLGATVYGPEVDIWSAGCIFLELFCKKPTFQGVDEIDQLDVVYRIMGTPTIDKWKGLPSMPWYELVRNNVAVQSHFRQSFAKRLSPAALDLAERLLDYDPSKRITASDALEQDYFLTELPPQQAPDLTTLDGEWHELESKRARRKRRAEAEADPDGVPIPGQQLQPS